MKKLVPIIAVALYVTAWFGSRELCGGKEFKKETVALNEEGTTQTTMSWGRRHATFTDYPDGDDTLTISRCDQKRMVTAQCNKGQLRSEETLNFMEEFVKAGGGEYENKRTPLTTPCSDQSLKLGLGN